METLIDMASDPVWWVSVVAVGMFVSIFAAYAKTWIDRFLSLFSDAWKKRAFRKNEIFWREVDRLRASPHEQLMAIGKANYLTSRGHAAAVVAVLFMVMMTSVAPKDTGFGFFALGMGTVAVLMISAGSDILRGMLLKNYIDNIDEEVAGEN